MVELDAEPLWRVLVLQRHSYVSDYCLNAVYFTNEMTWIA